MLIIPRRRAANTVNGITANANSTANPNGSWSFIRKTSITSSTVDNLTYSGTPGGWQGPEAFSLPVAIFSSSSIFMHPANTSSTVVVRWTAPFAAAVQVRAAFQKDTTTGSSNGVLVGVTKNNTTNVYGPSLLLNTSPTNVEFTGQTVNVAAGDVLDFYVNSNASFSSDHTNCTLLLISY